MENESGFALQASVGVVFKDLCSKGSLFDFRRAGDPAWGVGGRGGCLFDL